MVNHYQSDISREFVVGERVAVDRSANIHVVRDFGLYDVMKYQTGVVVASRKHMGGYMVIIQMDMGSYEAHFTSPRPVEQAIEKEIVKPPAYGPSQRILDI